MVETNTSNFALGAILSQIGSDDKPHLVSYFFHKFSVAKLNYEIYIKELLTIVAIFKEWRHFLERAQHSIIVYIDHKNLEYFMDAHILNRCHT